ncbi:excinuclease ABC subunit UvrB [Candidatus Clavichlamydia salmonicola]|uniref:excinuclease ABC subunit UvrB n=1 Tax=Candidatus Clavichlamydia salmonicola TaxID=469812 RepID=UPI001891B685|nr:excinuclease ABC subunit UvrB [Candidatus Clavichlamydia salmonicola]
MKFDLVSDFTLCGDQPKAVDALVKNIKQGSKAQVLLGVTGSGKTFSIANVIKRVNRPALILAHNKTLAGQLFQDFKRFFPNNAVEYFVSYYDYYQPEAYIARSDTYIEKSMLINKEIDKMRLSATRSLIERRDVIIVASVSCIYGLGSPEYYAAMVLVLQITSRKHRREEILIHLLHMQYTRCDGDFISGTFRVQGNTLEIFPSYEDTICVCIEFGEEDSIEALYLVDSLTGKRQERINEINIYPGSHHVTPPEVRLKAIDSIRQELKERMAFYESVGDFVARERLFQRTTYDVEMIKEVGFCKGIENYSRHFSQAPPGAPPSCLLNYFPDDYLLIIDESHQTLPQMKAMYNGDRARKQTLVDFGFRLPSAFDNRPLKFEEAFKFFHQTIYVSATPAPWEEEQAGGKIVEQLMRPTGIPDPEIETRPSTGQIDDLIEEIRKHTRERNSRVLVTVLTKKLAEEVTLYLSNIGVKTCYIHSDVDTIERMNILKDLRIGVYDVLVGINLLREGIDLPEVTLVAILDGDKEGFLRSTTALIQTAGRAARNSEGKVIVYADKMTRSLEAAISETSRRRGLQHTYNQLHGITPKTVIKALAEGLYAEKKEPTASPEQETIADIVLLPELEFFKRKKRYERLMKKAVKEYDFDEAARYRDLIFRYRDAELQRSS